MDRRGVGTLVLMAALSGVFANGVFVNSAVGQSIDEFVFRRLAELGIPPAEGCTDEVFVRRVYLDVIGTLPTPKEVRQFLSASSVNGPDKRSALIDRLLGLDVQRSPTFTDVQRSEEFADYWAMRWGDVLRVKAEFPINLWPNAVQAYHRWIRTSIRGNLPYDQFARELLTASGSNFRVPQVNFYRALQTKEPQAIAKTVALTFMGERADKWKPDRLAGMANFFAYVAYKSTREWKEDIVFFDCVKAAKDAEAGAMKAGTLPDGTVRQLSPDRDPREVFADWLLAPGNPWFARCIANRVWSWFLGRGIIHEPDDIRPDNPPRNPELLAHLERELVASKYDLKRLFRLILNSKTYQLSSVYRQHPAGSRQDGGGTASVPLAEGSRQDGGGTASVPLAEGSRQDGGGTASVPLAKGSRQDGGGTASVPLAKGSRQDGGGTASVPLAKGSRQDGGGTASVPLAKGSRQDGGGTADAEANFAYYPVRRLDAEVLIDALCQITGTTEEYSSPIPEPFTFLPESRRSIALPDGSITSSFLEMFGRPPRDTGVESERTNDSTPAQRLHFLNSSHVRLKIEQSRTLQPLIASGQKNLRSAATELYLLILSRFPTDPELAIVEAYSRKSEETRGTNALVDLAWALLNSTEFLCRH